MAPIMSPSASGSSSTSTSHDHPHQHQQNGHASSNSKSKDPSSSSSVMLEDSEEVKRKRRRISMDLRSPRMGSLDGVVLNGFTGHTIRGERDHTPRSETDDRDNKQNGSGGRRMEADADEKVMMRRREDERKGMRGVGEGASGGLTGKDRDAFILLVVLCEYKIIQSISRLCLANHKMNDPLSQIPAPQILIHSNLCFLQIFTKAYPSVSSSVHSHSS